VCSVFAIISSSGKVLGSYADRPVPPARGRSVPSTAMDTALPLTAFQDGHRLLDELMLEHQEALIALDLDAATRALAAYRAELEVHMVVEEELVIPAFEALEVEIRGGGAHYYKLEHKKLDELLTRVEADLEALRESGVSRPREVLPLLKLELSFEHVMEHHETRENYALYPTLIDRLPADAQAELWNAMQSRADQARSGK
jgi:hypothetical protein